MDARENGFSAVRVGKLSPRKLDYLALVGQGLTYAAISGKLTVQEVTVKKILTNARELLGVKTNAQAVVSAVGSGQLEIDRVFNGNRRSWLGWNAQRTISLSPDYVESIPEIVAGKQRCGAAEIKSNTLRSRAFRLRRRFGANSDAQLALIAVSLGYVEFDDILPKHEDRSAKRLINFKDLSEKEQDLVRLLVVDARQVDIAAQLGTNKDWVNKTSMEIRKKVGAATTLQMLLNFFRNGDLNPSVLEANVDLSGFRNLDQQERQVLDQFVANAELKYSIRDAGRDLGMPEEQVTNIFKSISGKTKTSTRMGVFVGYFVSLLSKTK